MKTLTKLLLTIVAAVSLTAAGSIHQAKTFTGPVTKVIDGDTFWMKFGDKKLKIRIWGINSPEIDEPGYKAAGAYLKKLIFKKKVTAIVAQKRKSFGRYVCKVYLGKLYINQEMIRAGFAKWCPKFAPHDKLLQKAQETAKK